MGFAMILRLHASHELIYVANTLQLYREAITKLWQNTLSQSTPGLFPEHSFLSMFVVLMEFIALFSRGVSFLLF